MHIHTHIHVNPHNMYVITCCNVLLETKQYLVMIRSVIFMSNLTFLGFLIFRRSNPILIRFSSDYVWERPNLRKPLPKAKLFTRSGIEVENMANAAEVALRLKI